MPDRESRLTRQPRGGVTLAIALCLLALALLLAVPAPPASADTAGHITGTVKNSGGTVLPGISVTARRDDGSGGWAYSTSTYTTASGTYDLGGLTTGTYRIQFNDNAGVYISQWYLNQPDLEHATTIAVTAGTTSAGKSATLVKAGHITGTVKNTGGSALANVSVYAYRYDGPGAWTNVAYTSTGATGAYDLNGLTAGTYRVQFYDYAGAYIQQWYLNQPDRQRGTTIAVTAGATSVGKNATLAAAGHITGTVKNAGASGLWNISVTAYRYGGPGVWSNVSSAKTGATGAYDLGGLTTGTYRIQFSDNAGAYIQQWYLSQPDLEHATTIAVTAGATSAGKSATLVKAGHVTGTVKNSGGTALPSISVTAYRYGGPGVWTNVSSTTTGATGAYDLGGLATGNYRVQFYDNAGAYIQQWYLNKPDREHATNIAVTAGATSSGKDATLIAK